MEVTLPYLFYEVNTALLLQPDQEITRKANARLRLLMNVDENALNKYETTVWVSPSLCQGSRLHCWFPILLEYTVVLMDAEQSIRFNPTSFP